MRSDYSSSLDCGTIGQATQMEPPRSLQDGALHVNGEVIQMETVLLVAEERGRPLCTVVAGIWCRVETVKGMRTAGKVTLEENGCHGRV